MNQEAYNHICEFATDLQATAAALEKQYDDLLTSGASVMAVVQSGLHDLVLAANSAALEARKLADASARFVLS